MRGVLAIVLPVLVVLTPFAFAVGSVDAQVTPTVTRSEVTCDRAPRTIDEIRALADTTRNAAGAVRDVSDFPGVLPSGTPVRPETNGEIRAMMDDFAACIQGGQILRGFAYLSDHYLTDQAYLDEDFLVSLETATPTPEAEAGYFVVRTLDQVERLADGRVGAVVTYGGACERSQPDPTCVYYALFVEDQGRWFMDEVIDRLVSPDGDDILSVPEYLELQGTPVATPTT